MDYTIRKISVKNASKRYDESCPYCKANMKLAKQQNRHFVWICGHDVYLHRKDVPLDMVSLKEIMSL